MAGPSHEQRILAAMAIAGFVSKLSRGTVDFDALAERIDAPKYGARTLRRIADPDDTDRAVTETDLMVIGAACGVSPAFWTVDFETIGLPNHVGLAEKVEALDREMDTVLRILGLRLGLGASTAADEQRERPSGPSDTGEPGPSG